MKFIRFSLLAMALLASSAASFAKDTRLFEMRTYYTNEGKLDDLLTRFRDHTLKLFERHGMENIGYFVPVDQDNTLVYFLAYPNREAREKAWKGFLNDPDWKAAYAASHVNGKLVSKVESVFLDLADYSPKVALKKSKQPRLFEIRTYTAAEGKLPFLDERFKNDTIRLFERHGITNVAYWHPAEGQEGHGSVLVYMLAFKDKASQEKSWEAFGADPEWKAAAKRSTEKAGGGLLVKKGVKSQFVKPVDFSKIQ